MNASTLNLLLSVGLSMGLALLFSIVLWAWVAHRRMRHLRARGYELIAALKAYSAWTDAQRDAPPLDVEPRHLELPGPLRKARALVDAHFPELADVMTQLMLSHGRLMEYFWQQSILAIAGARDPRPVYQDPRYLVLRDWQEDSVAVLISGCREIIGDADAPWRPTRSDFAFTNSGPSGEHAGRA